MVKGPCTCYSATHTRSQQRFTISEVAADLHESMILRRIMRPSIARDSEQLNLRRSATDIPTLGLTSSSRPSSSEVIGPV